MSKILAFAMILNIVAVTAQSELKTNGETTVYTNDFSYDDVAMREDTTLNWTGGDRFAMQNEKLVNQDVNTWTAVGYNKILGKYNLEYLAEADISVPNENNVSDLTHAMAVGVRVEGQTNLFIDTGLWFMIKDKSMNIIVARRSNEGVLVDIPFSFKKERRIYVEDKQQQIKFFANNDQGKKQLIAVVNFESNGNLTITNENSKQLGTISNHALKDFGYFRLMPHFVTCTVDNIKVTYNEADWSKMKFDAFKEISLGDAYSIENVSEYYGNSLRIADNGVICYKNIDFGSGASYFGITLGGGYNGCFADLYIDSQSGEKIMTDAWLLANQYEESSHEEIFPIKPVTGVHDIYLVTKKAVKVRWSPHMSNIIFYKDRPEKYKERPELYKDTLAYQSIETQARDLFADTWVGSDDLNRKLPIGSSVKEVQKDKTVLAFYFINSNINIGGLKINDNSKIIYANPSNPEWGEGVTHYWGEPYFGYYSGTDPWVIRKHAQMLVEAGVDAIVFDVSNQTTYDDVITAVCETFTQMRMEGSETPDITFILPPFAEHTRDSAEYLYKSIYSLGRYKDLWFKFKENKPFLLGDAGMLDDYLQNFFELRKCWAWEAGQDQWTWVTNSPQPFGWHESSDKPEEVSVSPAQHATTNIGRSYKNGKQPSYEQPYAVDITTSGEGIYFDEQYKSALQTNPEVLFITGWNEWMAGRNVVSADGAGEGMMGKPATPGSTYFVDCATPEYSRDIEPMRGFFYDNYYYQMAQNNRLFKGARKQFDVGSKKTIDLNSAFDQWDDVSPEYRDSINDDVHREHYGNMSDNYSKNYYENVTGRNDIEVAKVARDDESIYFYVRCSQPITSAEDTNWMNLYLNTNRLYKDGWKGYDFVVNHKLGTLEKFVGGWSFEEVCKLDYKLNGRELMIKIPKSSLGLGADDMTIDFKWADNSQNDGNVYDFMTLGDVAPDMRFNYRYTEDKAMVEKQVINDNTFNRNEKVSVTLKNPLLENMVVMKLNEAGGFIKNKYISMDQAAAVINGRTMVPVRFLSEAFGCKVDWNDKTNEATIAMGVYDKITVKMTIGSNTISVNDENRQIDSPPVIVNGRMLLPARALAEALNKNIMWDDEQKLIIIGSVNNDYEGLSKNKDLIKYIAQRFEIAK